MVNIVILEGTERLPGSLVRPGRRMGPSWPIEGRLKAKFKLGGPEPTLRLLVVLGLPGLIVRSAGRLESTILNFRSLELGPVLISWPSFRELQWIGRDWIVVSTAGCSWLGIARCCGARVRWPGSGGWIGRPRSRCGGCVCGPSRFSISWPPLRQCQGVGGHRVIVAATSPSRLLIAWRRIGWPGSGTGISRSGSCRWVAYS